MQVCQQCSSCHHSYLFKPFAIYQMPVCNCQHYTFSVNWVNLVNLKKWNTTVKVGNGIIGNEKLQWKSARFYSRLTAVRTQHVSNNIINTKFHILLYNHQFLAFWTQNKVQQILNFKTKKDNTDVKLHNINNNSTFSQWTAAELRVAVQSMPTKHCAMCCEKNGILFWA